MTTPRPHHVPGRTLRDLATRLATPLPAGADPSLVLTGVTLDSRAVQPGDVYAALTGRLAHGADFARQAAQAGAVAVLTDPAGRATAEREGLPVLVVDDPRALLGDVAAWVYGQPAADIPVTFGRAFRLSGASRVATSSASDRTDFFAMDPTSEA